MVYSEPAENSRLKSAEKSMKTLFNSITKDVKLGKGVKIYNFVNLYGCQIGDFTKIGAFVEIQEGVKIGKKCKISSHSFICQGVNIEDEVFIGHHVIFINDRYPGTVNKNGRMKKAGDYKIEKTLVKKGASIGSGSIIMCGITIGENAIIGSGSLVLKNVPANTIFAGNPAKVLRKIISG